MKMEEYYSLRALNTLALEQQARYFTEIHSRDELLEALSFAREKNLPWFILGGGSNLVLSNDYPGLVIHNCIRLLQVETETETDVLLTVGAGENWHNLVETALHKGWRGLENLALIPGTAGAAPVQNIGAYGVELCDVLERLEAWDAQQQQWVTLDRQACAFGYRDSMFKQQPGRYVIVSISLRLSKLPKINMTYQGLQDYFRLRGVANAETAVPTPAELFQAVVAIRRGKLPDPATAPNVGSFFKNPLVTMDHYERLRQQYPTLVSYPAGAQRKLAAGWLIEQAGWKGRGEGAVVVHSQQALVLVNRGGASGAQVLQLAETIRRDIQQRYGVMLDMEPVII